MKLIKKSLTSTLIALLLFTSTAVALTNTQLELAVNGQTDYEVINYGEYADYDGVLWPAGVEYNNDNGINGKNVTLQSRYFDETLWKDDLTLLTEPWQTDSTTYQGTFSGHGNPSYNEEVRLVFKGDEEYGTSQSKIVEVYVIAKLKLKAKKKKKIVALSGKLTPTYMAKPIIIKIKKKGKGWKRLAKVKTKSNGNFSYNWRYKKGSYSFQAIFEDDVDNAGTKSNITKAKI